MGVWDATSIVVGIILGAGIFVVPGMVARSMPSPTLVMAAWAFSGLLSFLGAMVFCELGTMIPETGGHYVFLREGLGRLPAFLFGWSMLLIVQPSICAYLSTSVALYLDYFLPIKGMAVPAVALAVIFSLCGANYVNTQWGASVQKWFTAAKLVGLFCLIAAAILAPSAPATAAASAYSFRFSDFGLAMVACLLSFEGWSYVSFLSGELRNPNRDLLRSVAIGLAICTGIYLLANAAYLKVLTMDELVTSARPGSLAADRALGAWGGRIVTLTVLCSIIGSLNGILLAPARAYFAQANDGLFFRPFANVHPKFRTPHVAIAGVGVVAALLAVTGLWGQLIDYAVFTTWVFSTLVGVALIVLRHKQPSRERPFRMWGYPWTAYLFVLVGTAFCVNMLIERPKANLIALAVILAGVPVYYVARKSMSRA